MLCVGPTSCDGCVGYFIDYMGEIDREDRGVGTHLSTVISIGIFHDTFQKHRKLCPDKTGALRLANRPITLRHRI